MSLVALCMPDEMVRGMMDGDTFVNSLHSTLTSSVNQKKKKHTGSISHLGIMCSYKMNDFYRNIALSKAIGNDFNDHHPAATVMSMGGKVLLEVSLHNISDGLHYCLVFLP